MQLPIFFYRSPEPYLLMYGSAAWSARKRQHTMLLLLRLWLQGQNVWRQPLKVTFIGEAGMDSGGVTREWFSCICAALRRGSLDLFWTGGPIRNELYINPLSNTASHLKRFHFVGMLMAKALLETAARGKELGPVVLNLNFCEPFWKLLLGIPLGLMDLQALDPTEFRSLMQILELDIDG